VRRALVLSDLHLGTGHRRGRVNIYDDFKEDERLAQLRVMQALGHFLKNEDSQITYLPGNHDMEMLFPAAQALFTRFVSGQESHPRVRFISDRAYFELDGVQFHHGHQFEALHAFDWGQLTLNRNNKDPVLNLPWGSLFILRVLNPLIRERPYVDKVHPFWPLLAGGMLFDTRFTSRMLADTAKALVQARLNPIWWKKRPFVNLSQFLSNDIAFFERLDVFAERIFKQSTHVHAVFMGHTHVPMLRTWRIGGATRTYVNTGTWMPMVDLGLGRLGQHLEIHYGLVEWHEDGPRAALHRWHGTRAESEEVIA